MNMCCRHFYIMEKKGNLAVKINLYLHANF